MLHANWAKAGATIPTSIPTATSTKTARFMGSPLASDLEYLLFLDDASRFLSDEEKLQTFRAVLRHSLERGELPPASLDFDLALIQAAPELRFCREA